jgi:hypothetical protein
MLAFEPCGCSMIAGAIAMSSVPSTTANAAERGFFALAHSTV